MKTVAYLGNHTALTETRFGNKIYVDTEDMSLAPHIMLDGDWEPWVTNFLGTRLRKAPVELFIDVGANFGWYTLIACRFGIPTIAFEPNPRLVELLRKTLIVNGYRERAVVVPVACGDECGKAELVFDQSELGGGYVMRSERLAALRGGARVPVDVTTIDTVEMLPGGASTIMMKIDVEGHEVDVLRGATKTIQKCTALLVEHHVQTAGSLYELFENTHTIRLVEHSGHPGAPLSLDGLRQVGEAETLLIEPCR